MKKENWILPKKYKFIADEFPDFEKDYKKDLNDQRHSIIEEVIEELKNKKFYAIGNLYVEAHNTGIDRAIETIKKLKEYNK